MLRVHVGCVVASASGGLGVLLPEVSDHTVPLRVASPAQLQPTTRRGTQIVGVVPALGLNIKYIWKLSLAVYFR